MNIHIMDLKNGNKNIDCFLSFLCLRYQVKQHSKIILLIITLPELSGSIIKERELFLFFVERFSLLIVTLKVKKIKEKAYVTYIFCSNSGICFFIWELYNIFLVFLFVLFIV